MEHKDELVFEIMQVLLLMDAGETHAPSVLAAKRDYIS